MTIAAVVDTRMGSHEKERESELVLWRIMEEGMATARWARAARAIRWEGQP